jgi:hypothetical protein
MRDAGMRIASPNLEPPDSKLPSESAPVFSAAKGGGVLAQLCWSLEPSSPEGRGERDYGSHHLGAFAE